MNTSSKYDSIEQLIYEDGLRITMIICTKEQDQINVILNTGRSLVFPLSNFKQLTEASDVHLNTWRLIADGVGVHWSEIDEDLSLKGFLREELKKLTGLNDKKPDPYAMAA